MFNNIKVGILIWVSFLITTIWWFNLYAQISSSWNTPDTIQAQSGQAITAENWNKMLENMTYLKDNASSGSSWGSTTWFASVKYRVDWNRSWSKFACKKILVPEECINDLSWWFNSPCTMKMSLARKEDTSSTMYPIYWWREVYFRIAPRWVDNNRTDKRNWLLTWYQSGWSSFYAYTTSSTESSSTFFWPNGYVGILWQDKRANCSQYTTNENPSAKDPRQIMLVVNNNYDWMFTIEYPKDVPNWTFVE